MKFKDMTGRQFKTETAAIGSDALYIGTAATIFTCALTRVVVVNTVKQIERSIMKIGGKISEIL